MKTKKKIDLEQLDRLRGVNSVAALARKFGVSAATIKRRIRQLDKSGTDKTIIAFAAKIANLAKDAPNQYCRKEVWRAVNLLRTKHAIIPAKKKKIIAGYLSDFSGLCEPGDVAVAVGFDASETARLLEEMAEDGIIERITHLRRGQPGQRGRTKMFLYKIKKP